MAEKRRGLGRGLGSLIPNTEAGSPTDVFFPRSERHADVDETAPKRTSDPAESMRRAQARRSGTKRVPTRSASEDTANVGGASSAGTGARTSNGGSDAAARVRPTKGTAAEKAAAAALAGATAADGAAGEDSGFAGEENSGANRSAEGQSAAEAQASATDGAVPGDDLIPVPGTTYGDIPIELIRPNPRQPREVFDEDALEELVMSIREIGVLQPVVVRRRQDDPSHYELIMGERRFRASQEAGKTSVPAIVRATTDDDLLRDALLENLHRVDLNPLEEAAAYAQLLEDFACTQEELSAKIGRSRPQISNTLRLLRLPPMVQRRVAAGVLSSGHARAILGLKDPAQMEVLAQKVVAEGLSVRATEESVVLENRGDTQQPVSRETRPENPALVDIAKTVGDRLDTRVNVTMGKRKGKISVEFANEDDLQRILGLLGMHAED